MVMIMERVVSIDSSTKKTGAALFVDGQFKEYRLIDFSDNKSVNDRMSLMGRELQELLSHWQPELVVIEEPNGYGKNIQVYRYLSEIIGIVRIWAFMHSCVMEEIKPTVWRKRIGINQSKKKRDELKAESIAYVKKTYGLEVNDDVADAICIGACLYTNE